jgi:hypothetical protein
MVEPWNGHEVFEYYARSIGIANYTVLSLCCCLMCSGAKSFEEVGACTLSFIPISKGMYLNTSLFTELPHRKPTRNVLFYQRKIFFVWIANMYFLCAKLHSWSYMAEYTVYRRFTNLSRVIIPIQNKSFMIARIILVKFGTGTIFASSG